MTTSILIAADKAVTTDERKAFLGHFPRQQGAHVADILDMLDNSDAYLEVVEPMYEMHGEAVSEPGLLRIATLLRVGILGSSENVTWEAVQELIGRIRAQM
ncbi:TPA: hypothetical protein ACYLN4_000686 [Burkholderia lata]